MAVLGAATEQVGWLQSLSGDLSEGFRLFMDGIEKHKQPLGHQFRDSLQNPFRNIAFQI